MKNQWWDRLMGIKSCVCDSRDQVCLDVSHLEQDHWQQASCHTIPITPCSTGYNNNFNSMTHGEITDSLTHWGRVMYICIRKLTIIGSDMACHLFGTKPLSEPMLLYCQFYPKKHISVNFYLKFKSFHSRKRTRKCHPQNGSHFVSASMC